MLKAKDIMTKELITVSPETEIIQAARIMLEKHINGIPVVDKSGRLVGIVCQSDLITQQREFPLPSVFNLLGGLIPITPFSEYEKEVKKMSAMKVAQAMTTDPVTVNPENTLEEVATLMVRKSIHTLPVVEQGKLVGVIGKEDVLRTLMPKGGTSQ
jgi:CBS domain-containing protein